MVSIYNMKKKFIPLIKNKIFSEAVWMHRYHQNIQNIKEDYDNCPICASAGELIFYKSLKKKL